MGAEDNIKAIQSIYEAFGRGDVEAILAAVTDDIDWASEASSTVAPWYGPHKGKDGVAAFFQEFGSTVEVLEFTPTAFGSNEIDVFASADPTGQLASRHFRICTTGSDSVRARSITTEAPKTHCRPRRR